VIASVSGAVMPHRTLAPPPSLAWSWGPVHVTPITDAHDSELYAATWPRFLREPTEAFDHQSPVSLRGNGFDLASGRGLDAQAKPCHAAADP